MASAFFARLRAGEQSIAIFAQTGLATLPNRGARPMRRCRLGALAEAISATLSEGLARIWALAWIWALALGVRARWRKSQGSNSASQGFRNGVGARLAWHCAKKGQGMAALTTIVVFIIVVLALNILDYGRVD